jgi:hypothetical protein
MTLLAITIAAYAACHAIVTISSWKGGPYRWNLGTMLPLAAILLLAWVVYERPDVPGWQVFVLALLAALLTALAERRAARSQG